MNKWILIAAVIAILFAGGYLFWQNQSMRQNTNATPSPVPSQAVQDGDDSKVVLGVFEGNIPCADCERIKMKLTLYQDPATLGAAGYTLDQVYVGKGDQTFSEQGDWDYLRGNDADPNATIYGLNLDKPKPDQQYFLKVGDDKVTLLDINMNVNKGNLNYTLTKVSAQSQPTSGD